MIRVSDKVKEKYQTGSGSRKLHINFPDIQLELDNRYITLRSFDLSESICDSTNIEFVGCISTCFQIEIAEVFTDISGQYLEVSIDTDNDNEPIYLFHGYVTDVEKQENSTRKKITCYDALYAKLSELNIALWYNSFTFPCTLKQFRQALFNYINLECVERDLPADRVIIDKRVYDTNDMNALDVIKQICQINCAFGIINRDGKFEFRQPDFLSNLEHQCACTLNTLKSIKRKTETYPLYGVEVRDNVDDENYAIYPTLPSKDMCLYIIEGNMFVNELRLSERQNLVRKLSDVQINSSYTPFNSTLAGLPYLEVGDRVAIKSLDYSTGEPVEVMTYTTILSRTLKGAPALSDMIEANGEENIDVIVTSGSTFTNKINSSNTTPRNMQYLNWQNVDAEYVIVHNDSKQIINLQLFITRATHVCVDMQFILKIDTNETATDEDYTEQDCTVEVLYYLDGVLLDNDLPIETCVDGYKMLRLRHDMNLDVGVYSWQVFIKSTGGTITIDKNRAQCYINADGLVGSGIWDGNINVEDEFEPIDIGRLVHDFDDACNITFNIPKKSTCTDVVSFDWFSGIIPKFEDNLVVADSDMMMFNAHINTNMMTVSASLSDDIYSNGTIMISNVLTPKYFEITDNKFATYLLSFDDGNTWMGYNTLYVDKWMPNYDMNSFEMMNIPESELSIFDKVMVKITMSGSYAKFTQLIVHGGKINA